MNNTLSNTPSVPPSNGPSTAASTTPSTAPSPPCTSTLTNYADTSLSSLATSLPSIEESDTKMFDFPLEKKIETSNA